MSASQCLGVTLGQNCDCPLFVAKPGQKKDDPHFCRDCKHMGSMHPRTVTLSTDSDMPQAEPPRNYSQPGSSQCDPESQALSIIDSILHAELPTSSADSSIAAEEEAIKGLMGGRNKIQVKATDTGTKKRAKVFEIGQVVLLTDGYEVRLHIKLTI